MIRWLAAISCATLAAAPAAAQTHTLTDLAFMTGCWRSDPDAHGTVLEEHYTAPADNLILGMSRYLRNDSAVSFEFSTLRRDSSGIVLTPRPGGAGDTPFTLASLRGEDASFENAAHDFPQRIRYRRDGAVLVARVESLDGRGMEWRMRRCG